MEHTANERAGSNNWKDKLEDAGALNDYSLQDKNAAWEKLHGRLHVPAKKKRAGWYWLAAACVVGFIGIPVMLMNTKQPSTTVHTEAATKAGVDTKVIGQHKSVDPVKGRDEKVITQSTPVAKIVHTKRLLKKIVVDPIQSIVVKNDDSVFITSDNLQSLNVAVVPALTAAPTPEKKKLKVVHVNELGTPLPELNSRVANDDYSVIQFTMLNRHFFNTVPAAPANTRSSSSKQKNILN